jgi:hypothetical protein
MKNNEIEKEECCENCLFYDEVGCCVRFPHQILFVDDDFLSLQPEPAPNDYCAEYKSK